MSWVSLAVLFLKLASGIVTWAKERELINNGQRQEIARQALAIAAKVHNRDQIREQVDALPEDQVDLGLHELEPK